GRKRREAGGGRGEVRRLWKGLGRMQGGERGMQGGEMEMQGEEMEMQGEEMGMQGGDGCRERKGRGVEEMGRRGEG
ncbi:unnamed protein product, partial [Closterium sp. NIES-64]